MRWGIETSFRNLTHTLGLLHLHAKKKVNFSDAVHICRQFFLGDVPPPILEAMLMRYISPIRPGRKDTRKLTQKSSASFTYRVA